MKLKHEWEENLRRVVVKLGHGLEALINKAKSARFTQKLPKMMPLMAIESQLPTPKIRELAQYISLSLLSDMTPALVDKSVLLVGEGIVAGVPLCRDKGASTLVQIELSGNESPLADGEDALRIHCHPHQLAVRSGSFDTVIGLLASPFQGEIEQALRELARTLVIGGDFLLADLHPFGLYAKRGSHRLRASFAHGIEDYYRMARSVGIDLTDCREGFCDEKSAAFFATPEEKQIFRRIKDSPLVIAFRGRKLGDVK